MKSKNLIAFMLILTFLFSTACSNEAKSPVDYPNTRWSCEAAGMSFSVSENSEITDAEIISKNGEIVKITIDFSETSENTIIVKSTDGTEAYFSGECTYEKKKLIIDITDVYSADFDHLSTRLAFDCSDL